MSREKLSAARELIKAKRYEEAAAILRTIPDDPQAQKWLGQMGPYLTRSQELTEDRPVAGFAQHFDEAFPSRGHDTGYHGLSVGETAVLGAMVAAILAALWVLVYLVSREVFNGGVLLEYVIGTKQSHPGFQSTEPMFVILSRFILAFGLTWGPASAVIYTLSSMTRFFARWRG
jgi:hypothetical protein